MTWGLLERRTGSSFPLRVLLPSPLGVYIRWAGFLGLLGDPPPLETNYWFRRVLPYDGCLCLFYYRIFLWELRGAGQGVWFFTAGSSDESFIILSYGCCYFSLICLSSFRIASGVLFDSSSLSYVGPMSPSPVLTMRFVIGRECWLLYRSCLPKAWQPRPVLASRPTVVCFF